jgi:hypothetical protein
VVKNQAVCPVSHYTLKRIEHLKRSIIKALQAIEKEKYQVDVFAETVLPVTALPPPGLVKVEKIDELKH